MSVAEIKGTTASVLGAKLRPTAVASAPHARYRTLDAMRGVAALVVAGHHFTETHGGIAPQFGYLSVDMFFLLSGFVLSLSYHRRLEAGMSGIEFMKLRLIRLFPIYLLGTILGLAIELTHNQLAGNAGALSATTLIVTSLLLLPCPSWPGSPALFPTMIPGWSLFFELYIANTLFATRARWSIRALMWIVAGAAIVLLIADALHGSIHMGSTWPTFIGGFPRVLFSFFAGVLLQKIHQRYKPRLQVPSWIILAILTASLLPTIPGFAGRVYEIACIFMLFPALVYWGAEALEKKPKAGALLGDMSFGIYAIHYPLLEILIHLERRAPHVPLRAVEIIFLALASAAAFVVSRYYDLPLRAAIGRWRLARKNTTIVS